MTPARLEPAVPRSLKVAYCKLGNFRGNFVFANSVKRRFREVKIRDLGMISKWPSDFAIRRGFFFHETSHAKFRENKTLAKISEFTVIMDRFLVMRQ